MKHAPPWHYELWYRFNHTVVDVNGEVVAFDISTPDNAHLIATAPTLLRWLEWMRCNAVTVETYPDDVTIDGYGLDDIIHTARRLPTT